MIAINYPRFNSAPFRSILGCALLLGSAALAEADVTLKGVVGARTIDDDVVVARNTTCVLNGTFIKGNIRVLSGAKLVTYRAKVNGNVQAFDAFKVELREFSRIGGDVQGEGTRSVIVRGGTRVGGNVQLTVAAAPSGVNALMVINATVIGDVQAEKGTGRLEVTNNRIDGNLQFVENTRGPYLIRKNRIDGDLQFFKNRGAGTITGNRVGGNLQSKENSPRPTVSGNIVEGSLEVE